MNNSKQTDCDWTLAELAESRLEQMPLESQQRLDAHLLACPTCRAAAAWDRQFAMEASKLPLAASRTPVLQILHARRRQRTVQRSLVALGAAASLGFAALVLWPKTPPQDPVQPSPVQAVKLNELTPLVGQPPVASLSSPQDAWLAVLAEECKGGSQ